MQKKYLHFSLISLVLLVTACDSDTSKEITKAENASHGIMSGQKLYAKNCSRCHGRGGKGTDQGPPFIHKIYEPNHHGDMAFYRAAEKGVQAHHWKFGNMPPVKGVSKAELGEIIKYIRHEQKKAGVF